MGNHSQTINPLNVLDNKTECMGSLTKLVCSFSAVNEYKRLRVRVTLAKLVSPFLCWITI